MSETFSFNVAQDLRTGWFGNKRGYRGNGKFGWMLRSSLSTYFVGKRNRRAAGQFVSQRCQTNSGCFMKNVKQ